MDSIIEDQHEQSIKQLESERDEILKTLEPEPEPEPTPEPDPEPEKASGSQPEVEAVEEVSEPAVEVKPEKPKLDELETANKRWRDTTSWANKLNASNIELKTEKEKLQSQLEDLKKQLEEAPPQRSKELSELLEEYPEMMDKLAPAIEKMVESKVVPLNQQVTELEQALKTSKQEESRREILQAHPDFDLVTAQDSRFWRWMDVDTGVTSLQKKTVADKGSNKDIMSLVTQFKREDAAAMAKNKKPAPPKAKDNVSKVKTLKKHAAEATAEPRGKPTNPFNLATKSTKQLTVEDIQRMSLDEYANGGREKLYEALMG